ncbi:MAG TPA: HAD-IB family phosphatase [Symbiobacteriaceae bacterium]|jgi:2,3-diketo-5-methylthio-1-phosphopentane phosphatase
MSSSTQRTEKFWRDAAGASLVVLTDFDFTISEVDIGDLITNTFSPPSAETLARYRAYEIGTRLYWADSMARVDPNAGAELAATVGIDPHFAGFARWAAGQGIPMAVVSDGFWFYISRVLSREGLGHLPVFCNDMPATGRLEFPNGSALCDRCGCCKAGVARRVKAQGAHVVYCGDGSSDIYGSGFADWVFAKGRLARYMERRGSPFFPLDSFDDVYLTLSAGLDAFRAGTAPGRATLGQHEFCRF